MLLTTSTWRLIIALWISLLPLISQPPLSSAQELNCEGDASIAAWHEAGPHFEVRPFEKIEFKKPTPVADDAVLEHTATLPPRSVCFTAARFKLSHNQLSILNVYDHLFQNANTAGGVRSVGSNGTNLVPVTFTFESVNLYSDLTFNVLTNAGWSTSGNPPAPDGYLRIDGKLLSGLAPSRSLSVLICFDNRNIEYIRYNRFPAHPWNDLNWSSEDRAFFDRCKNMIQVGPAILEKDNRVYMNAQEAYFEKIRSKLKSNEIERVSKRHASLRTCFSRDARIGICGSDTPRKRTVLAEDSNGFVYLITTLNDVHLIDIQEILLTDSLSAPGKMLWAVNLAGASQAGMALRYGGKVLLRNVAANVFSAILVQSD